MSFDLQDILLDESTDLSVIVNVVSHKAVSGPTEVGMV